MLLLNSDGCTFWHCQHHRKTRLFFPQCCHWTFVFQKAICELWCFGRDIRRARSIISWLISASFLTCVHSEGCFAQNWAETQRPSQKAVGAAPGAADATFHLSSRERWGESPDLHFLCPATSSPDGCIPPSGQFISHGCLHWWIFAFLGARVWLVLFVLSLERLWGKEAAVCDGPSLCVPQWWEVCIGLMGRDKAAGLGSKGSRKSWVGYKTCAEGRYCSRRGEVAAPLKRPVAMRGPFFSLANMQPGLSFHQSLVQLLLCPIFIP